MSRIPRIALAPACIALASVADALLAAICWTAAFARSTLGAAGPFLSAADAAGSFRVTSLGEVGAMVAAVPAPVTVTRSTGEADGAAAVLEASALGGRPVPDMLGA